MLDLWKTLTGLVGNTPPSSRKADAHRIAAAALLVEAGCVDGQMDGIERDQIESLLANHFGLDTDEARSLLDAGEKAARESVEWHGFTHTIMRAFDHDAHVELIEMLWQVVLSDGRLHDYEASLMRRITGLLYVSGSESAEARNRARKALGLD
ncbi:MAG: TerB family tellurite resistance protein [Geminicoccaceae bacterium]|nr:TerB family tellurite resistance protein [Geminicoccaceae bacterium]